MPDLRLVGLGVSPARQRRQATQGGLSELRDSGTTPARVCAAPRASSEGGAFLHIAPERTIDKWLKDAATEYLSIDLESPDAMRQMDLTALDLPDKSFDLIWCSHVLEHIPDDAAAMREMRRVLRPGGIAVIQVPIWRAVTYEDWNVTTPEQRLEHFLQRDHVRLYGLDLAERLTAAGFDVTVRSATDLPQSQVKRQGLSFRSTNEIFIAGAA